MGLTLLVRLYSPVLEILVLITFAKRPLLNTQADISSRVRGLQFWLNVHLHDSNCMQAAKALALVFVA